MLTVVVVRVLFCLHNNASEASPKLSDTMMQSLTVQVCIGVPDSLMYISRQCATYTAAISYWQP